MRLLALAALFACSNGTKRDDSAPMPPPSNDPPPRVQPDGPKVFIATPTGDVHVAVEVVATDAKIERGLMYRQHLPPEEGMLFLLGIEKDWSFWMHNTLIPLDMIFIKSDMTIAGVVENAEPKTDTMRTVGVPSVYVLEVNAGWAGAHHVATGARVRFDKIPPR